jgi:hypothetical protein
MKFNIEIKGIAPLLMHKFSESAITGPRGQRKGDSEKTKEEKIEAATPYLYVDAKKKLVQPGIHIEMAMAKAATDFRLSGAGKKSYKEIIQSACFIDEEYIPHKNQKWIVDARAVVNASTGGRVMSYRPRLDEWCLAFTLEVLDDRADPRVIKEILAAAGLRKGIGAYRPRFGRFEVSKFQELKGKNKK